MSNEKVRTPECTNCNKFSHCNNNDLVCIKKFIRLEQQKQYCRDFKLFQIKNVDDLQDKNKKLVEALELIMNNDDEPSFENYTATQALLANEVNK